jgi:uncharacterized protein YerC
MPKVSQNKLSAIIQTEILQTLFLSIAQIQNEKEVAVLLRDLLTPTEQVMIAKRLMTAMLCERGYPVHKICSMLKLSRTTVTLIRTTLARGGEGYRIAADAVVKKSKVESMLKRLDQATAATPR